MLIFVIYAKGATLKKLEVKDLSKSKDFRSKLLGQWLKLLAGNN